MPRFAVCLTTVSKRKDAERIARHLVERRFAACVNVVPGLISHYRWKGTLCRDSEILLLIKTKTARVKALERELLSIHPYAVPEFVVLPIQAGSLRYLRWIDESLRRNPPS